MKLPVLGSYSATAPYDGPKSRRILEQGTAYAESGDEGEPPIVKILNKEYPLKARVVKIGGFSAHADQAALKNWYSNFEGRPPVSLVHGEEQSMKSLAAHLHQELSATAHIARPGEVMEL